MNDITPEKLAKLRELAQAANQTPWRRHDYNYVIPEDYEGTFETCWIATCFTGEDAAHIAAADPQTVLALVEEVERLRLERDFLVSEYERAVGCDSQGYIHASMNLFNAIANPRCDKIADLTGDVERLQARVAELEAAMAQRMGVYAAPKGMA